MCLRLQDDAAQDLFLHRAAATNAAKMHAANVNSATGHWSTHRMYFEFILQ